MNQVDDPDVRNLPGLSQLTITTPFVGGLLYGTDYRIYVETFNVDSSTASEIATITLADIPLSPSTVPAKEQSKSTTTSLFVSIEALTTEEKQGLPILSYCLEIDRNLNNNYESILGCEFQQEYMNLDFLIKSLTNGNSYGFRYKAKNAYGWGSYSDPAILLVATEPAKPRKAPTFIESSDTNLHIGLDVVSSI